MIILASEKCVHATYETLSQRFARVQEEIKNEIQFKEPSRTQEYLKGSINSMKFHKMKLNLKRNAEDIAAEAENKRQRIQAQCVQVEISDMPQDW